MNVMDRIQKAPLRRDLPPFRPGDTVRVHVRVTEGDKQRIQVFAHLVLVRLRSVRRRLLRQPEQLRSQVGLQGTHGRIVEDHRRRQRRAETGLESVPELQRHEGVESQVEPPLARPDPLRRARAEHSRNLFPQMGG